MKYVSSILVNIYTFNIFTINIPSKMIAAVNNKATFTSHLCSVCKCRTEQS